MIKTIYLDMDGVLADFDKHFEDLYGITSKGYEEKHGQIEFWRKVYCNPKFFITMPKAPHFMDIMRKCTGITNDVCILSSPSVTNQALCMIQKRKWIDFHLGGIFPAIFERDKHKYANPNALLIDDTDSKVRSFLAAGGNAFLYSIDNHQEFVEFINKLNLQNTSKETNNEMP